MNRPELHRVEVIQKLSDKRLTECEAAEQCHLSVRQIRRLRGSHSTLRLFSGPQRPELPVFNLSALPPNVIASQIDVLPTQRRQVLQ